MLVIQRMMDFELAIGECKHRHLPDLESKVCERYHCSFFIATDFPARGQGLASKIIARYQEKSAINGLPI